MNKIKKDWEHITFYLTLLDLIIFCGILPAQSFRYSNFTSENGLSNNTVNCIYQDKYCFLWFGTNNGLNKYDGYVFTNYHSNHYDTTSLSSDFVTCITEDNNGNLWISTREGVLNKFDRNEQTFTRFKLNSLNAYYDSKLDITSMASDEFGNIWVGTKGEGVFKFNTGTNEFISLKNDSQGNLSFASDTINVIRYIGNSKILAGTPNGLTLFNFKNNITANFHKDSNKTSLHHNYINCILKDNSGNIWIGTANTGFQLFDEESGQFKSFDSCKNNETFKNCGINCIAEDKSNNIIISDDVDFKIHLFNISNSKSENINYNYISSKTSPEKVINQIFVDCNNILWIGYRNMGIGKYNLNKPKFGLLTFNPENKKAESGRKIKAIATDENDNIWLASIDGLVKYNKDKELIKIYEKIQDAKINFGTYQINAIISDKSGNLWLGTDGGGLYKFNIKTEKITIFKHLKSENKNINSNFIQTLFIDKEGIIWIGTRDNGINTFDTRINKFITIPISFSDPTNISNDNISIIYEDKDENVWIGTHSTGLVCYHKESDKFTRYRFDASNKSTINSDNILSITEDNKGKLWIGTDNGLEEFNNLTESFIHYLNKDGLVYEVINSILVDDKNNLWLATNNGVTKYNTSEKTFRIYNTFDGLQSGEFYQSSCKNKRGEYFFCGINGVNYFIPDCIKDKPNNSPLILTSIKTSGNYPNIPEDLCDQKEMKMKYNENSFSFGFSLLDFTNPSFYTYAYKMDEIDKDWNYTKSTRSAIYSNLEPGHYVFSVKAINSDNMWSQPVSLSIEITSPFWRTWWFYTLLIISVMSVALTNFKRLYYYKRYNKLLELDITEKTKNLEETNLYLQNEIVVRKQTEDSLRYSEEQYKLVVENAIEGILIFRDNKIIYNNPQLKNIIDFEFKDMSFETFLNYIHPDDRKNLENNYFSNNGNVKNYYSVRIKRRDSKEIIVEINSIKLKTKNKEEIVFFIKDITSRKHAEEEIKKSLEREKELSELRSRFISMTSHEFRTPLTSINTSAEILEKFGDHITYEQRMNNLLRIQENVQKMKRLLNDVLIIGKSDAGRYKLKLEPVNINQLCSQIMEEFNTYILYNTKHKFKFECENLNNRVLIDNDLIKQAIENLLTNAVKYSPDESTVYFKMSFSSMYIIFEVKDEGIGIPEDEMNNLFEPFFRASNTGKASGSGLGLAIVKRAVELHNGRINVNSKVGKGTEFILNIPLIKVV